MNTESFLKNKLIIFLSLAILAQPAFSAVNASEPHKSGNTPIPYSSATSIMTAINMVYSSSSSESTSSTETSPTPIQSLNTSSGDKAICEPATRKLKRMVTKRYRKSEADHKEKKMLKTAAGKLSPKHEFSCGAPPESPEDSKESNPEDTATHQPAVPTFPRMDYAYPCDKSPDLYEMHYLSERMPIVRYDPSSTSTHPRYALNPSPTTESKSPTNPFVIPGMVAPQTERKRKIPPRMEAPPCCFSEISDTESSEKNAKMLDIIFVPEAQTFCLGLPAPILVIGTNKNFKAQLSNEEFEAKAKKEIADWTKRHTILKGEDISECLANVEMIVAPHKIFDIFHEMLGFRGWNTICCDYLSPRTKFFGRSLNGKELFASYRSDKLRYKCYSASSVCAVLRYFVDFPDFIKLNIILEHPLFSDKELTNDIDRLCSLLESVSYDDDIFSCLSNSCIMNKVTHDKYRNPTLQKMQALFEKANSDHDLSSLMKAIGYFNLVRAIKILPFK